MRPLLHQGKANPVAQGQIIDPKKFRASTKDFYRKQCVLKFCSLGDVDVASILFLKFLLTREFYTVLAGIHS